MEYQPTRKYKTCLNQRIIDVIVDVSWIAVPLIFTIIIIMFLHELGHIISALIFDQEVFVAIVKSSSSDGMILPYTIGTSSKSMNIFTCLLIPIIFQLIYLIKENKSCWWIPYILWGHRFDFFVWIVQGCVIF